MGGSLSRVFFCKGGVQFLKTRLGVDNFENYPSGLGFRVAAEPFFVGFHRFGRSFGWLLHAVLCLCGFRNSKGTTVPGMCSKLHGFACAAMPT